MKQLASLFNRGRVMHYADLFIASFVIDLAANQQHILGAHGLNALGSIAAAGAVVAAKATIEGYRKANTGSVLTAILDSTIPPESPAEPPPA